MQSAQATNGQVGYIFTRELRAFQGCGFLDVYESDGTTVIGKVSIGIDTDGSNQCDTLSPSPSPVG